MRTSKLLHFSVRQSSLEYAIILPRNEASLGVGEIFIIEQLCSFYFINFERENDGKHVEIKIDENQNLTHNSKIFENRKKSTRVSKSKKKYC